MAMRFLNFRKSFFFTLIILLCGNLYAHPDIEPLFLPSSVLKNAAGDSAAQSLSADEVFKLSLLYSECPLESESGKRCLEKFEKLKTEVSKPEYMGLPPEERGRAVLKLLYRDYLKAYSANQTRTDEALETGRYNCVSSAVLYMAVAKASGLEVRGQKTTQHAFCSIYVPAAKEGQLKKIDVETTNPYGFNPGSRETIENEANIKKYYVVPKKYYSNRLEVSDLVFPGLIAGNLCSEKIKKGDYEGALPLGAARYEAVRLESSKAAKDVRQEFDILAANYVNLNPASVADFSEELSWFAEFTDRWGMNDFLQKNMDNAYNNLIILCLKENAISRIEEFEEKYQSYVSANQISKTKQLYQETIWLNKLNDYMNQREYQTGLREADEALRLLPQSTRIKNMRTYFYNNCIAVIHNNFAAEANAGRFEEALKIISEGLELFPNDKTLRKDYNELIKILDS